MELLKRNKGFRSIVVRDKPFSWIFSEKIIVHSGLHRGSRLTIDFCWFDIWLYVNDPENRPPDYYPGTITPDFVRRAIEFALEQGWNTESKPGHLELTYKNEQFRLISNEPA